MVETPTKEVATIWEPYEFILKINDKIVCQRYFKINDFKRESLISNELTLTVRQCVSKIKEDLNKKSRTYSWCASPMVFGSINEAKNWLQNYGADLKQGKFVSITDDKNENRSFIVGPNGLETYSGFSKIDEFNPNSEKNPCLIEFGFYYRGKKVCAEGWDGNVYPKFVRTNIDISNSKNRYKTDNGKSVTYDALMIDYINKECDKDLIPEVIQDLCTVCSFKNPSDYTRVDNFGASTYSLNNYSTNNRRIREWGDSVFKKTVNYYNSIGIDYIAMISNKNEKK